MNEWLKSHRSSHYLNTDNSQIWIYIPLIIPKVWLCISSHVLLHSAILIFKQHSPFPRHCHFNLNLCNTELNTLYELLFNLYWIYQYSSHLDWESHCCRVCKLKFSQKSGRKHKCLNHLNTQKRGEAVARPENISSTQNQHWHFVFHLRSMHVEPSLAPIPLLQTSILN